MRTSHVAGWFRASLHNLQAAHFKSPEIGTEFGSFNVRHVKTKGKGPRHLEGVSQREQLDRVLTAGRPSFPWLSFF